jgi:acetyl-CoA acetyltransferase family protein
MRDVVITGYLRTPNSRAKPRDPESDWFHALRADDLLARVLPELLARAGVRSEDVDDCIVGSALGVGEQWTYGGRTPVFLADLSETVPAKFLDMQCGSSMAALHTAFMEIAMGFADTVLACGMEHMTRVPIGPTLYSSGLADVNPRLVEDPALAHWDMAVTMNMGLTAEKLARHAGIGREEMDAWAVRSHHLAAKAMEKGFFTGEILPVKAPQADGSERTVDADQCIRPKVDAETMAGLKPVPQPSCSCPARRPRDAVCPFWDSSAPSVSPAWTPPSWAWPRSRPPCAHSRRPTFRPRTWTIGKSTKLLPSSC